jgi:hypothetical protein
MVAAVVSVDCLKFNKSAALGAVGGMRYHLFLLYGKEGKMLGARDEEAKGQKQILSGTHSLAGRAHQKIAHDPNGRDLVVGRPTKVAGGGVNPDPPPA